MPVIQLQPNDVVKFWDGIKYSLDKSRMLAEDQYDAYMNHALEKLLAGKLTCWLVFSYTDDKQKQIHAMIITSILKDRLFGFQYVFVEGMYGFRKLSDQQALDLLDSVKLYARNTSCKYIIGVTETERAKQIADKLGFTEVALAYSLEV